MKLAVIEDGRFGQPGETGDPDRLCMAEGRNPDPRMGDLVCYRNDGHDGPHWDQVDEVAWRFASERVHSA